MEEKEVILTQEGFDKIEKELEYLRTEKRSEIADRIKVALGFGDLSENSEYDDAKNEQALLELRIQEIENTLRHAKVVDDDEVTTRKAGVGTLVTVHDYEFDEDISYGIVGATEVNMEENKMSAMPVNKLLLSMAAPMIRTDFSTCV